jgi:hypothetical protein
MEIFKFEYLVYSGNKVAIAGYLEDGEINIYVLSVDAKSKGCVQPDLVIDQNGNTKYSKTDEYSSVLKSPGVREKIKKITGISISY